MGAEGRRSTEDSLAQVSAIPEPRQDVVSQSFHGEKRRAIRGRNRQREMREPPPETDDVRRCRVAP
jgi:hypothetical protein